MFGHSLCYSFSGHNTLLNEFLSLSCLRNLTKNQKTLFFSATCEIQYYRLFSWNSSRTKQTAITPSNAIDEYFEHTKVQWPQSLSPEFIRWIFLLPCLLNEIQTLILKAWILLICVRYLDIWELLRWADHGITFILYESFGHACLIQYIHLNVG